MTIVLKIEGAETDITQFALPEMSLSSGRTNMDRKQFQIAIDADKLLVILEDDYKQWVAESKEDDEQCGGPQDELAEAGYPNLSDVLENSELLDLVVGYYLFDNLIEKFSEPGKNTKYWCDEIIGCLCFPQKVLINGVCYSKRSTIKGV